MRVTLHLHYADSSVVTLYAHDGEGFENVLARTLISARTRWADQGYLAASIVRDWLEAFQTTSHALDRIGAAIYAGDVDCDTEHVTRVWLDANTIETHDFAAPFTFDKFLEWVAARDTVEDVESELT